MLLYDAGKITLFTSYAVIYNLRLFLAAAVVV